MSIKFETTLQGPIAAMPQLDGLVGRRITVTVDEAETIPSKQDRKPRQGGWAKGEIWMSPEFDEPLDDFKDYM